MNDQPRPTPRTSALAAKYIASPHTAIEAKEIWVLAETLESESDARAERIAELQNLASVLLGPCNPPLDCPREELVAFINSLTPGQRVIERGQSCMIGQTGTVILYDGSISVRWDTVFREGTGMVTSVTGGTRRIESGSLLATKESESAKLREALKPAEEMALWLEAALKCKDWHWDSEQYECAESSLTAYRQALAGKEPHDDAH